MAYVKHPIGAGKSERRADSTGSGKAVPSFLGKAGGARPGMSLTKGCRKSGPVPGSPAPGGSKPSGSSKKHPSGIGSRMWHR